MADYNIYIRTVGGGDGSGSPTTPFQTGGGDGYAAAEQFISKAGAFASNPDSAIGAVKDTAVGAVSSKIPWVGIVILAVKILASVTDSVLSKYYSYTSSATGDYTNAIKYNNVKQVIHNITHPISTMYNKQQAQLEVANANMRLKQEQLLTGGTILNSPNGRFL